MTKPNILLMFLLTGFMLLSGTFSNADDNDRFFPGAPPPQKTDLKPDAPGAITLKYKPEVSKGFKPFLGTGVAYSLTTIEVAGETKKELKAGIAGTAGFNLLLNQNSSLYFDYKYLYLTSDTRMNDGIAPQLIGIGLDLKF